MVTNIGIGTHLFFSRIMLEAFNKIAMTSHGVLVNKLELVTAIDPVESVECINVGINPGLVLLELSNVHLGFLSSRS